MNRIASLMGCLLAAALTTPAGLLMAQDAPPASEIYLAPIEDGALGSAVNITRHPGYDNQPAFSPDSNMIFFTRFDDGQTDIWQWSTDGTFADGDSAPVTVTPESEYSPTPAPGRDALSMVRVEQDGRQLLGLHHMESGEFEVLAPELDTVGYHQWYSPGALVIFLLPEPFQLTLYASAAEQLKVAQNIGRAFYRVGDSSRVIFLDKSKKPWRLREFDTTELKYQDSLKLFPGQEDFFLDADGDLWTAAGSRIYRARMSEETPEWRLAGDFRGQGIRGISRLAVSPDGEKIAFVAAE